MSGRTTAVKFALLLGSFFLFAFAIGGWSLPDASLCWTLGVAALGCGVCGLLLGTAWQRFGAWTALALIGQACALQMLDVGKGNRLQFLYRWETLLGTYRAVFVVFVLAQALLVLWGIARSHASIRRRLSTVITVTQGTELGVLWAFATVQAAVVLAPIFVEGNPAYHLATQSALVGLALLVTVIAALNLAFATAAIPADSWDRIVAFWRGLNPKRVLGTCVVWTVLASAVLCWAVFDRLPHLPDDIAYLFHAKYFAAGKLYLPLPPEPKAFACGLVLFDGDQWYSAQLPGWPAVLAIGAWAGAPWLVNPLLGGLAIFLAYLFLRRLYDEQVAIGTVLLLATSPWLLYMSATFMGHPVSLVLTLAALLGVHRARETGNLLASALAGLAMGGLALTRPLEALALVLPLGIWWLAAGWQRIRISALAATTVCGLAVGALMPAYNVAVTGDARTLPFARVMDLSLYTGVNRVGFGKDVGNFGWTHLDPLPGHGPVDVVVNTNQNLYMLQFELFGWACGSLLFVFSLVLWREWRRDVLMWGLVIAIWAGMSTYWFSGGPDFGARYWYQMILPLAVLTVRGAQAFAARWDDAVAGHSVGSANRVWAFVVLASLTGFVNVMPWRAIDKYKNYREVRGDVRRLAGEYNFGRSLVFVRGEAPPLPWGSSSFGSAFSLNPPTLDRNAPQPIYVRDLGPESREALRKYYFDRPVWILADPRLTGDGFQVLEGPLPPFGRNQP